MSLQGQELSSLSRNMHQVPRHKLQVSRAPKTPLLDPQNLHLWWGWRTGDGNLEERGNWKGDEKCKGSGRKRGLKMAGSKKKNGKNCTTLCCILQLEKSKENGANKSGIRTRIEGYGRQIVWIPFSPHPPLPHCAVPENIHIHPIVTRGWGVLKAKLLKESMKLNWKFQRGGGGGPTLPPKKNINGGRYG